MSATVAPREREAERQAPVVKPLLNPPTAKAQ